MTYDPHKKYVKAGECNRCGRCCDQHCEHFVWEIITSGLEKGEQLQAGLKEAKIYAICKIWDTDIIAGSCTPDQRKNFPYNPWQTPPKCGFTWVEVSE